MDVETLTIPKKKAEQEFQALRQAFKQNTKLRREEIRQDLKKVYSHMRHGKKVIDIYESFKKAGLNKNRNPKLAICRADGNTCYCYKNANGGAVFSIEREVMTARVSWLDVAIPNETYDWMGTDSDYIPWDKRHIKTVVPIIPAKILVNEIKVLLKNFHILWEVEEWKPVPPRDPILLKRLTPNLYGVLATWNLTKLERAVIRGRI